MYLFLCQSKIFAVLGDSYNSYNKTFLKPYKQYFESYGKFCSTDVFISKKVSYKKRKDGNFSWAGCKHFSL